MKEIECTITGKVQMVTFRGFVQKKARSLGIHGYVENTEDRSVYVVAQGTEDALKKLIAHLHKGPFLAKVARVLVEWQEPRSTFREFIVKY